MNALTRIARFYYSASHLPELLAPLLDFALRLYVADVFFKSGLTKIKSWDSTLYLFSDVYQVPLIPSDWAAYMATAGELGLSVLLVLGLFGRFATAGLFILNAVAAYSYYSGLSEAGLFQHFAWGTMLAVLLILSWSKWSIDTWFENRLQ
ncbi:MAG: DoxX family protein [Ferrovum sp.]|jgi:putative oxidoreductase|nr:DoxX family protein [Ferrovum sp.]